MNVPLILPEFLDRAVSLYGDKQAVFCDERQFTYAELNGRVNQLSHGLRELGVEKGNGLHILRQTLLKCLKVFMAFSSLGPSWCRSISA